MRQSRVVWRAEGRGPLDHCSPNPCLNFKHPSPHISKTIGNTTPSPRGLHIVSFRSTLDMSAITNEQRRAIHESLKRVSRPELVKAQTAVGGVLNSVLATALKQAEALHSGDSNAARDARARVADRAQHDLLRNIVALLPAGLPDPLGRMVQGTESVAALKAGATAYLAAVWRLRTDFPDETWGLGADWLTLPEDGASQADRVTILDGYAMDVAFFPRIPEAPDEVGQRSGGDGSYGLGAGGGGGGGGADAGTSLSVRP